MENGYLVTQGVNASVIVLILGVVTMRILSSI